MKIECENCTHSEVCKFKEHYFGMVEAMKKNCMDWFMFEIVCPSYKKVRESKNAENDNN